MSQHSYVISIMLVSLMYHLTSLFQSYVEKKFDILNGEKEMEAQKGYTITISPGS